VDCAWHGKVNYRLGVHEVSKFRLRASRDQEDTDVFRFELRSWKGKAFSNMRRLSVALQKGNAVTFDDIVSGEILEIYRCKGKLGFKRRASSRGVRHRQSRSCLALGAAFQPSGQCTCVKFRRFGYMVID
jgi:hypothetical protein